MILRTSLLELKQAISNLRVQLNNNMYHSTLLDYANGIKTEDQTIKIAIDELKKKQTVEKEYK